MTVLTPTAKMQFFAASGAPLVGGLLYTYAAGTTTPQASYTDSTGSTPNSNPVVLDSRGEANVWLGSATYKFKLCAPDNTEIWTVDNISAPTTALSPVLTGNVTIGSSSSGAALKITQTGTGPIFVAQNVADPDTTPVIIDANNNLGIQTTSPGAALDISNSGAMWLSNGGVARSIISADASNSYYSAEGARSIVLKANGTTLFTINTTNAISTIPIILPSDPTTSLQASTKNYVDTSMLTSISIAAPPGAIMAFASGSPPSGWLTCAGQVISQTTYAALYAVCGSTWNVGGEAAGTFRIPDFRGMFLRMTGTNGVYGTAVGPAIGGYQADTYLNHSHTATSTDSGHTHNITYNTNAGGGGGNNQILNYGSGNQFNTGTGNANITTTVATSTTGGTETKPKNYGILYIIKT